MLKNAKNTSCLAYINVPHRTFYVPQGYSVIDVELLYHAIKHAALSDLEQFKKTGRMPFSNGYIDISKK